MHLRKPLTYTVSESEELGSVSVCFLCLNTFLFVHAVALTILEDYLLEKYIDYNLIGLVRLASCKAKLLRLYMYVQNTAKLSETEITLLCLLPE